jgi:hypothetical protein
MTSLEDAPEGASDLQGAYIAAGQRVHARPATCTSVHQELVVSGTRMARAKITRSRPWCPFAADDGVDAFMIAHLVERGYGLLEGLLWIEGGSGWVDLATRQLRLIEGSRWR